MYGPAIEGNLVRLRPHQPSDAADFIRMLANPLVTRYLVSQEPLSLEAELQWIEARATDPNTLGWTIEVDGHCVGSVGFDAIDWRNGHATVGIFIGRPEIWGKGITTEVARLLVSYAFTQLPIRKIKSGYLEPNVASAKVQARVGLREVGRLHDEVWRDGRWVDHILTELTREEWEIGKFIVYAVRIF